MRLQWNGAAQLREYMREKGYMMMDVAAECAAELVEGRFTAQEFIDECNERAAINISIPGDPPPQRRGPDYGPIGTCYRSIIRETFDTELYKRVHQKEESAYLAELEKFCGEIEGEIQKKSEVRKIIEMEAKKLGYLVGKVDFWGRVCLKYDDETPFYSLFCSDVGGSNYLGPTGLELAHSVQHKDGLPLYGLGFGESTHFLGIYYYGNFSYLGYLSGFPDNTLEDRRQRRRMAYKSTVFGASVMLDFYNNFFEDVCECFKEQCAD